jgi:excisionase family DNA binding protein
MGSIGHVREGEQMLSLPEVAVALRCSVETVRRMISRGELLGVRVGGRRGRILIAPATVENFLIGANRVAVDDRAPGADAVTAEAAAAGVHARHAGSREEG